MTDDDELGVSFTSEDRTSSTAYLPDNDNIARRLARRAVEFQGFTRDVSVELQTTRYYCGQEYKSHFDWYDQVGKTTYGKRISTFFVILESNCTQCGTHFPDLHFDCGEMSSKFNEVVDCGNVEGTIVRPIPRSAIFWRNRHLNGTGNDRTLHAGLPPEGGIKIGLNIWTNGKMDHHKDQDTDDDTDEDMDDDTDEDMDEDMDEDTDETDYDGTRKHEL